MRININNSKIKGVSLAILIFFSFLVLAMEISGDPDQNNNLTLNRAKDQREIRTDQEEAVCLVPCDEIVNGGPGKDGIPSIDNPKFYSVEEASADLNANDLIVGVEIDGQMYGFPLDILYWHEVVNVKIKGAVLSITYCPLTGTAIPYDIGGEIGVSGNLYENNLVFYDRDSDSYWAQMYGTSIMGEKIGETAEFGDAIETTWSAFSLMFPDAQILSRDTGYNRNYDNYPYARYDYLESEFILFGSSYDKDVEPYSLYHPKDMTAMVFIEGEPVLLPFLELDQSTAVSISHNGKDFALFFNKDARLALPYFSTLNGQKLEFSRIDNSGYDEKDHFGLTLYEDQFGNVWNMKGQAIAGPDKGTVLERVTGYNAFWFAAITFFGDAPIYQQGEFIQFDIEGKLGEYTGTQSAPFPIIFLLALLIPVAIRRKMRR